MTATPTPEKKPAIAWHRVNEKHERQYQKKQEQLVSYTPFTLQTEAKRSEPKRSEANRTAESAPFTLAQNAQQCAFHNSLLSTLHTVECASFHTGSEAKRSALLSVVMGSAILVKAIHLVPFLSPSTSGLHARVP